MSEHKKRHRNLAPPTKLVRYVAEHAPALASGGNEAGSGNTGR